VKEITIATDQANQHSTYDTINKQRIHVNNIGIGNGTADTNEVFNGVSV